MKIRPATLEDSPFIVSLWERTGLNMPWHDPAGNVCRALENPTSTIFIAEENGQLIGSVMAGYDGRLGWIYYLAVDPAHQSQGLGSRLLAHAEDWLKPHGTGDVFLMIRAENATMKEFYLQRGYEMGDMTVMKKRAKSGC